MSLSVILKVAVIYTDRIKGASQPTSNLKVALVETRGLDEIKRWKLPPDQYSNRVSSLTPTSVGFLDGMRLHLHMAEPSL